MTRFWTSDTHFSHKNIIVYSERPFNDIDHMDAEIVRRWNETVGLTDVVYHLGDVAMGDSSRWDDILNSLNGYKILITGNHDRVFQGEKARQREKWDEKYHEWFDEVHDNYRGLWLDNGTIVDLSHFPYDGDSHGKDRYTEARLPDTGRVLIHGHTHAEYHKHGDAARVSRSKRGSLQIHVGQDAWHYKPVSEDKVIDLIESAS